jgi:hypothetical protein
MQMISLSANHDTGTHIIANTNQNELIRIHSCTDYVEKHNIDNRCKTHCLLQPSKQAMGLAPVQSFKTQSTPTMKTSPVMLVVAPRKQRITEQIIVK